MTIPRLSSLALFCSSIALLSASHAATLVNEDFSYADGNLVGNSGWTNVSGTGGFLMVTGGSVGLQHGTGSREDAGILFSPIDSGVLLASFDIVVNDDAAIAGTDLEYFAHFSSSSSNFTSRLDVVPPSAGGDYSLGIATFGGTADQTFPIDFTFGNTVSVQLGYDFGTATSILTVGTGFVLGAVDGTPIASLNGFNLRQSTSDSNESITIDNLVVTGIPEPSSAAFGLLGLLALFSRRRR